ncbi:MAG: DUF2284 domain-containing protein [bacterium]|nr:DUF2284 domain-containing protein [bacterium]
MRDRIIESMERHEKLLPIADFDVSLKYKDNCLACPNYGKNLSCPPFSPAFSEYLRKAKEAKVICLRLPLETLHHLPAEERARAGYENLSSLLISELQEQRKKGHVVAGAGECKACKECPIVGEEGICIKPDKQIYSLESLGANLSTLIERCFDFSLEWDKERGAARHVCAVGAVFFTRTRH